MIFVYPVLSSSYLGENIGQFEGGLLFGKARTIQILNTRPGAGGVVHGAVAGGSLVSVLVPSDALNLFLSNLVAISKEQKPAVFHVPVRTITPNLSAVSDYSDILALRSVGLSMIHSATPQEGHDIAIIAQAAAIKSKSAFIHFYNSFVGNTTGDIKTLSGPELEEFIEKDVTNADRPLNVVDSLREVFTSFNAKYHTNYSFFEYIGSPDAKNVIVSMGAHNSTVEEFINSPAQPDLGLLVVRVLRPWAKDAFLAALPKSVQRVAVLDQSSKYAPGSGPLFLEVLSSLFGRNIKVIAGQILSKTFSSIDAKAIFNNLVHEQPKAKFVLTDVHDPESELSLEIPEEKFELPEVSQAQFWYRDELNRQQASKAIAHLLVGQGSQIRLVHENDSYTPTGGVVSTTLQFSDKTKCSLNNLENKFVLCDSSLVKEYNITASLQSKGHLVLDVNTNGQPDFDITAGLPASLKRYVNAKAIQFHTIDSNHIFTLISNKFPAQIHEQTRVGIRNMVWISTFYSTLFGSVNQRNLIKQLFPNADQTLYQILEEVLDLSAEQLKLFSVPSNWVDAVDDVEEELPTKTDGSILSSQNGLDNQVEHKSKVAPWYKSAWNLIFSNQYETQQKLKPAISARSKIWNVRLTKNVRVTPTDYDRNIFHMEIDISGTDLVYTMGDALAVYGHNNPQQVNDFITWYNLNPTDTVYLADSLTGNAYEVRTVYQILLQHLDLFGRPAKKFYQYLLEAAQDPEEKKKLEFIVSDEGKEEFAKRVANTVTYADLLKEFSSARIPFDTILEIVPPIKARHYSIASSMKVHPTSVHLLVVVDDWTTPDGVYRQGHTSSYLASLQNPETQNIILTVSVVPSLMKLPPSHEQPVLMAGLGTGMAPFRAFIQERAWARAQGHKIGPMVLYFGSRFRQMEYLYGEELEAYHASGVLTHLRLAFSRDQKEKVYIQHKLTADKQILKELLLDTNGHFYLCGPTWPAGDVYDAIVSSFQESGKTLEDAQKEIFEMKESGRYVLEVY